MKLEMNNIDIEEAIRYFVNNNIDFSSKKDIDIDLNNYNGNISATILMNEKVYAENKRQEKTNF